MMRHSSLRTRITAAFAVTFVLGCALLLGAAYVIVTLTTSPPVTAEAVAGTITASRARDAKPSPSDGQRSHGTTAAARSTPAVRVEAQASSVIPFEAVQEAQAAQRRTDLRSVLRWFVVALGAVIVAAVAAGWWFAGRALAPVRKITATARAVSESRLDARIALEGPDDELRELGETFDAMLARLERAFVAQQRFVACASHELRTPLAVARMEAELAQLDHADEATRREALEEIHTAMVRGGALVDALLELASAGSPSRDATLVALAAVVEDAVAAARGAAAHAGVTLAADVDATAPMRGRPELLRALVDNLLANGIAYNVPGGWVRVQLHQHAGSLRLAVANSGPAVAVDAVDELFEPFVRAEPSRSRRSGGAGLGLAIVRTAATAHGGRAEATPRAEGGLCVTVVLPAIAERR